MTFTQKFSGFVCLGDSITCEVEPYTVTARIAHDDTGGRPDQRQDGFWPSLYKDDAGFIGAGNGFRARFDKAQAKACLLYTSPSPRDQRGSRMPSSA